MGDQGSPRSLEDVVHSGDALLEKKDFAGAGEPFQKVKAMIDDCSRELAQASDAARNQQWLKEAVERLNNANLRTRAGRVRALNLSPEARAKLEEGLEGKVPAVK